MKATRLPRFIRIEALLMLREAIEVISTEIEAMIEEIASMIMVDKILMDINNHIVPMSLRLSHVIIDDNLVNTNSHQDQAMLILWIEESGLTDHVRARMLSDNVTKTHVIHLSPELKEIIKCRV